MPITSSISTLAEHSKMHNLVLQVSPQTTYPLFSSYFFFSSFFRLYAFFSLNISIIFFLLFLVEDFSRSIIQTSLHRPAMNTIQLKIVTCMF